MKVILIAGAMFLFCMNANAQENSKIRSGNNLYKKKEFEKSIPIYEEALKQNPKNEVAAYNLGNALFRSKRLPEATEKYAAAAETATNNPSKERSTYNKGVSYTHQQKLLESIEAYKAALRLDPTDADARHNLQKALFELKQQQNKEQKENKDQPQQQKQQQKQQKQQSKLTKKQVENYLKALQQREQQVQKKAQQQRNRSAGQPEKDW